MKGKGRPHTTSIKLARRIGHVKQTRIATPEIIGPKAQPLLQRRAKPRYIARTACSIVQCLAVVGPTAKSSNDGQEMASPSGQLGDVGSATPCFERSLRTVLIICITDGMSICNYWAPASE
jgi:hypothetical protein